MEETSPAGTVWEETPSSESDRDRDYELTQVWQSELRLGMDNDSSHQLGYQETGWAETSCQETSSSKRDCVRTFSSRVHPKHHAARSCWHVLGHGTERLHRPKSPKRDMLSQPFVSDDQLWQPF
jgi:hypothetical protein